ncbi:MAG: exodeoxyribonuclease I [Candidatus Saccharibacteria bacterium]|nr:exodeoxyribonuclease I [Candidatus Saccharibacteria bacterium]
MANSFYFYDLETSGINPRESRIMQFAGQRTDLDLNPIGEPHNILIALSDDILPDPDAILITGITPQHTVAEGTTEADFLKTFEEEIATQGTIFVGYNTIRFDDEFMRYTMYRNMYDPYTWQWKDDRSRWDLLDVVRMTRALRPEGITWPVDGAGKPTNRLELLTAQNGLDHAHAHDALSDVNATIDLAKLLRSHQPKLFDYLLSIRDKKSVKELVESGKPFVYCSGKYANEYQKTAVVIRLADHPQKSGALVYDLRFDPTEFQAMEIDQLVDAWRWQPPEDRREDAPRLPIKTLQFNRCPAVAPLAVLDPDSQSRLQIDIDMIQANRDKLAGDADFSKKVLGALAILDAEQQKRFAEEPKTVDAQLYDGFMSDKDHSLMQDIRSAKPDDIGSYAEKCHDQRLKKLVPLYKARNYPRKLTIDERRVWETHRADYLMAGGAESRLAKYFERIKTLSAKPDLTDTQKFLLEDLTLYGQSIVPSDISEETESVE